MLVSNKTSSELTNKIRNQMLYANYIIQKQSVSQGCLGTISIEGGSAGSKESKIWTQIKQGESQTSLAEQTAILTANQCPVGSIPFLISVDSGSMVFNYLIGANGTSVTFANDADLAIGTEDFTIEWFQYWELGGSFPRVFSVGTFPDADIAVSYEGTFYVWVSGSPNDVGPDPPQDEWAHIALVGNGSSIKVYVNGSLQNTITTNYDFTNTTTALAIGNQTTPSSDGAFTGNISNFRWVVGTQVYTGNFTVPSQPLTAISGTQLLLVSASSADVVKDSSSKNRTPTNNGVTFSSTNPF